ncbi:MAG: protein kinase [Archangium sp.]|nr:protein kinase [Archangium sp.]
MPISTGGMGEIFLARLEGSHGFDKLCVIKKILPHLAQDQDFVARFVDEARILVKLSHGNIAQVLDMGVHEGEPYIALEFVDGKDLRRVLSRMRDRQLPLPLSFVLSVMTRVLDALAYAHRKRGDDDKELELVHRDVSPQNVLISYEGEVKVIDFGLAKSALSLSKTNPSIVMGKFMYMAPEQARHKTVDRRSDLYAVGLCLWELVTGKNPFEDVPSGELMGKVGNPSIPALNTIEPLCPQALSDAVGKALAPDPANRFQNAEEFRGKLQSILQDIDPLSGAETTSRFMRDAFSAEYQAERRMLHTVREQAKALGEVEASDETVPEAPAEETMQNAPSPFATHPTPLSMPAINVKLGPADDETPAASRLGLQPEALSFQPTRKAGGSSSKSNEVHEKETMPSIQLKTEQQAPPPSAPQPIRARLLAKSFDQDATEASTPAIAEPEPLPSIVIDGIPSEPINTELEIPAQQLPPPPRASKASLQKQEGAKKTGKSAKVEKRAVKETRELKEGARPEKLGERPVPRVKISSPVRTDTQVLPQVSDRASPGVPTAKKAGTRAIWFVLPALAVAAVVGTIAWDIYSDRAERQRVADEQETPQENIVEPEPAPKRVNAALPEPEPEAVKAEAPQEAPKKKQAVAAPKVAKVSATPGEGAMRALQGDFDRLVDEAVQRKFRLQISALEGQVDDKGSDPAFVKKVQALHEQVKTALAKQQ